MGEYRVHWETRLSILPLFDVSSSRNDCND